MLVLQLGEARLVSGFHGLDLLLQAFDLGEASIGITSQFRGAGMKIGY